MVRGVVPIRAAARIEAVARARAVQAAYAGADDTAAERLLEAVRMLDLPVGPER
ncbi:hypothetical protein [Streptomyces sp. V3I7]|uniref:hypothetical protein n=1 Tax=Streptomyces sp. V3I7 TaxID=3042278 RepID=UPI002782C60E|nr:hypothetical protein [Streptomyces sp. V3I7]MDQ0993268.1 hypothetical protein [Streptomyces sp. V3I7]